MTYSQRGEDDYVAALLPSMGRYLEIGSYDGKTFSNIRLLAERGWGGVCIEPAAHAFDALVSDPPPGAILVNALVGSRTGLVAFHYTKDALSSTLESHARKWSSVTTFASIFTVSISMDDLLEALPGPYDLISIDTEGTSVELLEELRSHIDDLETRCLIVEHDGIKLSVPGFTEIHRTEENSIMVRG